MRSARDLAIKGAFEPERVVCVTELPIDTEPFELVTVSSLPVSPSVTDASASCLTWRGYCSLVIDQALSKTYGEVCYASVQPPDEPGSGGMGTGTWALVTFKHAGPAASATAKGGVTLSLTSSGYVDGGADSQVLVLDGDVAPTPIRAKIERLSLRMAEATLWEEQQANDAFKHFSRSQKILLTIRNVLDTAELKSRRPQQQRMSGGVTTSANGRSSRRSSRSGSRGSLRPPTTGSGAREGGGGGVGGFTGNRDPLITSNEVEVAQLAAAAGRRTSSGGVARLPGYGHLKVQHRVRPSSSEDTNKTLARYCATDIWS